MKQFSYIAGLVIAIGAFAASITHLKQSFTAYFDLVAFLMVIGGTTSVAVITLPLQHFKEIWRGIQLLVKPAIFDQKDLVQKALELISSKKWEDVHKLNLVGLPKQILEEGAELMQLGFPTEKIEILLYARIDSAIRRRKGIGQSIKSLAKYPPAFGLMGTVLGLVNLMRQLSAGAGAQQTGLEMSVALVATLYGLLFSNLVIFPAGEAILQNALDEQESAELVAQTIILSSKDVSLIEAQEFLNSYVDTKDRSNILAQMMSNEAA